MKFSSRKLVNIVLVVFAWVVWLWVADQTFSNTVNLSIILGGILVIFPVIWFGRLLLDRDPTPERAAWVTTFVHYGLGIPLGAALTRAVITHQDWFGGTIPIPPVIGLVLAIISGAAFLLVVANLALKGLGAPFALALSEKLASEWMYAWTRNPMLLAGVALLLSLGLWFQSVFFLLWSLILVTPAMVFFMRYYEERELEIRFGSSYLEYRSRTPFLFPRKPRG
jgi:protein-S-isoprenylcysteine O-methyltransferase Ste14